MYHTYFVLGFMEAFAVFGDLFSTIGNGMDVFRYVWFFIIPPLLWWVFFLLWDDYSKGVFIGSTPFDIIEVIPPRDTERSPQPMELVFAGIQGVFKGFNAYEDLCEGQMILPFSFELAGTEGRVRFFVRCQSIYRGIVESNLYAQYPTIQILDVDEDYTKKVPAIIPNKNWNLWGSDMELVAPDPVPIKTWPHFEEDITGKMIDPLAGLIELMGRARRGEHLWLQLIATPYSESWFKVAKEFTDEMKGKAAKPQMGAIGKAFMSMTGFLSSGGDGGDAAADAPLEFKLSPGERKVLEAIEENSGRYVFQVKMRMMYLGRKEIYDGQMISGFFGALKQFADFNLNSFKPDNISKTTADFLFRKVRVRFKQRKLFERYTKRKTSGTKFFLSDRELATVYHMPDMSVMAPSITRSSVTQSSAPSNLPIGQQ